LFSYIKQIKEKNDIKKLSKDFIDFTNSRNVKEMIESTCPDIKETQFAKQKKIKCFEELDTANFHDQTDIKNTMTDQL
jgi:hypothetical protein